MEPIVTTLRIGLSTQTRAPAPESERVTGVDPSGAARDHGDGHPAFPVQALPRAKGHEAQAEEPLQALAAAPPDDPPPGPVSPARLAAALLVSGDPALLRVAAALAGAETMPLQGGRAGGARLDEEQAGRDGRRGYARLLLALPALGALEIRVRIDPEGVAALVLAGTERGLAAAKAAVPELQRALVRATGLRGRADVLASAPEEAAPAAAPPQPEAFDAYA